MDRAETPPRKARGVAWWRSYVVEPEPELRDAGLFGELLTARARLMVVGLLLLPPLFRLAWRPRPMEAVAVSVLAVAFLYALAMFQAARRRHWRPSVWRASSLIDVALVSATLAGYVLFGDPVTATNSTATFAVYLIAIGATALRFDLRVCLLAGASAIVHYLLVVAVALAWSGGVAELHSSELGSFSWGFQAGRLVLLVAATVLAMVVVRMAQELRRQSVHDNLTGLVNRAYLAERLRQEIATAGRRETVFAVALVDIDGLKSFNDRYGHAAGDAALVTVAVALRTMLRDEDVVARYGGDELALLLPGMNAAAASARIAEVQAALRAPARQPGARNGSSVTVSAGVASFAVDGGDERALLAAADRRLYRAKALGRDRVIAVDAPGDSN